MEKNSYKIFVDTVHGEINIPTNYCKYIIDTPIFQRLRRIEQTSMRGIYPSAHHDRFIHSLGTYHIGVRMFEQIQSSLSARRENRIEQDYDLYNFIATIDLQCALNGETAWDVLKRTFTLACLLHDSGHAPFSHCCEIYYEYRPRIYDGDSTIIHDIIELGNNYIDKSNRWPKAVKNIEKERFAKEIRQCGAKQHELVSAWLVLHPKAFGTTLFEILHADPLLMARMITGCKFTQNKEDWSKLKPKQKIEIKIKEIFNCFISLLNGGEIDADRLDYALRDNWASGLNPTNINANRLITSLTIAPTDDKNGYDVCFNKQALPDVQCLLENKNYTYFWVFNHHKTEYQQRLLRKAIEKLAIVLGGDKMIHAYFSFKNHQDDAFGFQQIQIDKIEDEKDRDLLDNALKQKACYDLFCYTNLIEPVDISFVLDGKEVTETLYLTSDDDIIYLLKKYFCKNRPYKNQELNEYFNTDNYAIEWLSRRQDLIPVWKSFSEFKAKYVFHHQELKKVIDMLDALQQSNYNYTKLLELHPFPAPKEIKKLIPHFPNLYNALVAWKQEIKHNKNKDVKAQGENLLRKLEAVQEANIRHLEIDFTKAMENVLKRAEERYSVKQVVKCQNITCEIGDFTHKNLYVYIDGIAHKYNLLDLPLRSHHKVYKFFYMYVPRMFLNDKEVSKDVYYEYYTKEFQQEISSISSPIDIKWSTPVINTSQDE